jgi:hypothetical protein
MHEIGEINGIARLKKRKNKGELEKRRKSRVIGMAGAQSIEQGREEVMICHIIS